MEHQDWTTVILTKPKSTLNKSNNNSNNKSNKNNVGHITKKQREIEGDDIIKPKKISNDIKISIQKARLAKKMSQKELAQALGVQQQIIVNYENGKAIPNNQFISKIEKMLNTKIPRIKQKRLKNVE